MDHLWTPWRYSYVTKAEDPPRRKGVPDALAAWPGDLGCVFCNMIAAADWALHQNVAPGAVDRAIYLLERGKSCYLVLNGFPYNNGHLMIVPYAHQASLAALPLATAAEMMLLARRAERALRLVYKPHGLNFGLNLGEAAGAGVAEHLHLHALPRWSGDTNFMTVVAETRILPEMLEASWERLREALAQLPPELSSPEVSSAKRSSPVD